MSIDLPGAYSLYAPKLSGHDGHADPATESKTLLGFWIYLMTDCIIFASLFAVYGVVYQGYADGPTGKEIFDLSYVLVETFLLLISSLTYGLSLLNVHAKKPGAVLFWLGVTFVLGLGFVGMEVNEFHHLIAEGNGPQRSAFLSAFFTLVGTHGFHVASGLLWMALMMVQVVRSGLTAAVTRRLACLSLFWHFLDIVWICVFTVIYLMGSLS